MASIMNTRQVNVSHQLSDDFEERAFDTDIILPDYCPDVSVILKCNIKPMITAHFRSGDRYTVDGVTLIRVLYLTEDRTELYSYETTQPFTVPFQTDAGVHHYVDVKTDYVNCRATGPRRIDVHGAIRVYLNTVGTKSVEVFDDPCREDVFCRCKKITATIPVGEVNKSFYVNDMIDLGKKAERQIYTDIFAQTCEQKVLTNKLIVKGVLSLKSVVATAKQSYEKLYQDIPYSQIIDIDGLTEEWFVKTKVSVGEVESYLQDTENGGTRLVINCKLVLHVCCGKHTEVDVVLDAYSTQYPFVCETDVIAFTKSQYLKPSKCMIDQTTDLPKDIVDVVDLWGEIKDFKTLKEDDNRYAQCCLLMGMVGKDVDGHLGYYERTVDCRVPVECEDMGMSLSLGSMEYRVANGELRVKMELEKNINETVSDTYPVVCRVAEDRANPYEKNGTTIRLVYIDDGADVWDIAKKHHSSVENICRENDLTTDRVSGVDMLIVPIA